MISHVILREICENPAIKAHAMNSIESKRERGNLDHGDLCSQADRMVQIPVECKGLRRCGRQSVRRKELAIRHDVARSPDHNARYAKSLQETTNQVCGARLATRSSDADHFHTTSREVEKGLRDQTQELTAVRDNDYWHILNLRMLSFSDDTSRPSAKSVGDVRRSVQPGPRDGDEHSPRPAFTRIRRDQADHCPLAK